MDILLNSVFPVLMYTCGVILLIVLIVLGIKLIGILGKVDKIVDNVDDKVNSLNRLFTLIDQVSSTVSYANETVIRFITNIFSKLFGTDKKKEDIE